MNRISSLLWACALGVSPAMPATSAPAPVTPRAQIGCEAVARASLVFDCTIRLADARSGAPVSGAQFTVAADMPSMPMAHNVRPVAAQPTGEPGVYRARITLEMEGLWALKLRLTQPMQRQISQTLEFVDGPGR